ncbi:MAG: DUF4394 domain-containing protein [Saprospiraceae bacterium]
MKRNNLFLGLGLSLLVSFVVLTGCAKDESVSPGTSLDERGSASGTPANSFLIGLSANNEIVKFSSGPPAKELAVTPIIGLDSGEMMLAIDYRPRTGKLYGVSSASKLYYIDIYSGLAGSVAKEPFKPVIQGSTVGFEINPIDDRARIVTDDDQNLRLNVETGEVIAVDANLTPSLVALNSIAYANSVSSGLVSPYTLYGLDMSEGKLYRVANNAGTLSPVGSTGVDILSEGGFDAKKAGSWAVFEGTVRIGGFGPGIGGNTDDLSVPAWRLWSINLVTGAATSGGQVRPMIGIAIP